MNFQLDAILNTSRRRFLFQRRWMSNGNINVASTRSAPSKPLISRQLLLQFQQHMKSKKLLSKSGPNTKSGTTKDETPWPRNIVYGAYVAMSICIPYSLAWFLSSNEPVRTVIFPYSKYYESSFIIEWMRGHFGIPDYESIAEPERVQLMLSKKPIPHRFVDEPPKHLRQQQLYVDQQHERNVKVRLISGTATTMEHVYIVDLPAKTLARYEELVEVVPNDLPIQPPIALDFNDFDDEEIIITDHNDDALPLLLDDATTTVPSMSIYSLWHYQPPASSTDNSSNVNPIHQMSPIEIELSRVQYEMDILYQELKNQQPQRPIDDIQEEIVKLKSLKRQLRWRKWFS